MIWIALEQLFLFFECFLFVEFVTRFNRIDWTRRACRIAMILAWAFSFLIVVIPGPLSQNMQARLLIRTAILFLYTLYFLEGPIIGKVLSCLFFPFILLTAQILVALPLLWLFSLCRSNMQIFGIRQNLVQKLQTFYCAGL